MIWIIWSYDEGKYIDDENGVALEFDSENKALQYLGHNYNEDLYLIESIPSKYKTPF